MEQLWSISTTIREAERITGFLRTASEISGEIWNASTQSKFQILLVQNRQYLNDPENSQIYGRLDDEQCELLRNKAIPMTYEQAEGIILAKNYEGGSDMRGRQSMSPLYKLGLVYIVDGKVHITDAGQKLINEEISFGDFILDAMLKFQYPNPYERGYRTWNTKPFINALRLIKRVNELCETRNIPAKGITKTEFGIFVLSLKNYTDIDRTAKKLLDFRIKYSSFDTEVEQEQFRCEYAREYLSGFKNPEKNTLEYADNMIRYMRLTKYICIRGKYSHVYIDLEPRRLTEINSILQSDDGSAAQYSQEEWRNYMGTYGAYPLPFETIEKLKEILENTDQDINTIEHKLGITVTCSNPCSTQDEYRREIEHRRKYRTELQNLEIKQEYHHSASKIDEVIKALEDIRNHNKASLAKRFSIELEKWANVALNIINDSILIKPNAPVGDDNEPTYTAPSGVADIECFYESFNAICEVTMLTSRDQWFNEGQPVMRHLRDFEKKNNKKCYCLFVAPRLHQDTVNTFYNSVKYEYEGKKQKIIPITISQLISILQKIRLMIQKNLKFTHTELMKLYDTCVDMNNVANSQVWLLHIQKSILEWTQKCVD